MKYLHAARIPPQNDLGVKTNVKNNKTVFHSYKYMYCNLHV